MTRRLAISALVAAALAGCDSSGHSGSAPGPPPSGARVFATAGCPSCHTLAAANAAGQVGPNLDDVEPSAAMVRHQVTNGGGGMPSFQDTLSPQEIDAVAAYVARVAGTR